MQRSDLFTGLGPWTTVRVSEAASGFYWVANWSPPGAGEVSLGSGWSKTLTEVAQHIREWLSRVEEAEAHIWVSRRAGPSRRRLS